jgi:hypothetical protein
MKAYYPWQSSTNPLTQNSPPKHHYPNPSALIDENISVPRSKLGMNKDNAGNEVSKNN